MLYFEKWQREEFVVRAAECQRVIFRSLGKKFEECEERFWKLSVVAIRNIVHRGHDHFRSEQWRQEPPNSNTLVGDIELIYYGLIRDIRKALFECLQLDVIIVNALKSNL